MFCHKCGNKAPEDSVFCVKCGEKFVFDDEIPSSPSRLDATPIVASPPVKQSQVQEPVPSVQKLAQDIMKPPPDVGTNELKKKAPKKLIIGIAAVVAVAILVVVVGLIAILTSGSEGDSEPSIAYPPIETAPQEPAPSPTPTLQEPIETPSTDSQEIQAALLLYLDVLNETIREEEWRRDSKVSLIYIDDDDVPELVVDGPSRADGCQIYTVSNGELVLFHGGQGGIYFFERQNLFLETGGGGGYFRNNIVTVENGSFVTLHEGRFTDYFIYNWNGVYVTSEEYSNLLGAAFDGAIDSHSPEQARTPRYLNIWHTFSILSTASNSLDQAVTSEEMIVIINARLGISTEASEETGEPHNINQGVTANGWQRIYTDLGSLRLPPTWDFNYVSGVDEYGELIGHGYLEIFSIVGERFYLRIHELSGGGFEGNVERSMNVYSFTFDDGHLGVFLENHWGVIWAREDWWAGIYYHYDENPLDPSQYDVGLIHAIAGTFLPPS